MRRYHPVDLCVCCLCGGRAEVLLRHRSAVPFRAQLANVWRYPLHREALPVVLGTTAVLSLYGGVAAFSEAASQRVPLLWAFAVHVGLVLFYGLGVGSAFVVSVIRQTARGSAALHTPEFAGLWPDVVRPALFSLVAALWVVGPALLRWKALGRVELVDPVAVALMLVGLGYAPMVLVLAGAGATLAETLNPLRVVAFVSRLWPDYPRAAVLAAAAFLSAGALQGVSLALWRRLPLLGPLLAEVLVVYLLAVGGRVLGLLLWSRGDVLEHGVGADYWEPALPGVEPRGEAPPSGKRLGPLD